MNTFITSDTHFGHAKTCLEFTRDDGSPLRPFASAEEMDEEMISRWNAVVGPKDKVYHLGDVVIQRKYLGVLSRLNGDKVLIRGNHDIFKLKDYALYFRDIRGYHVTERMIFSHVPIHPDCMGRFVLNIHGHLHEREVMREETPDPMYISACVERWDYAPVELSVLRETAVSRRAV